VARETQKGSMAFGPTHVDSRGRSQKIKKETMAGLRALSAPKVGSGDTCGDRYFAGICSYMEYVDFIYLDFNRT